MPYGFVKGHVDFGEQTANLDRIEDRADREHTRALLRCTRTESSTAAAVKVGVCRCRGYYRVLCDARHRPCAPVRDLPSRYTGGHSLQRKPKYGGRERYSSTRRPFEWGNPPAQNKNQSRNAPTSAGSTTLSRTDWTLPSGHISHCRSFL